MELFQCTTHQSESCIRSILFRIGNSCDPAYAGKLHFTTERIYGCLSF